jgi:ATP-dependent protease ClpP protease subunit
MSLRQLPNIQALQIDGLTWEAPVSALAKWPAEIRAADAEGESIINIYGVIGADFWGDGITAASVAATLRQIGNKPVTVSINSPGGDMFEGIAIYNLLRQHPAEVTVKIVGYAASAASVIAMAGDTVLIARSGFLMIHNAWVCACGDRHYFTEIAAMLEPFDAAMADVYASRSGQDKDAIAALMDAETWIGGVAAIEQGFADDYLPADQVTEQQEEAAAQSAARRLDLVLAKAGLPRSERRSLMKDFRGTPGAAAAAMPGAGDLVADLRSVIATLKS